MLKTVAKKFLKKLKKGVDFFGIIPYNKPRCPGVAQLVARLTGGQEAVSSSLATRTKTTEFSLSSFLFSLGLVYAIVEQTVFRRCL